MLKEIRLDLHKEGNSLILDCEDIYKYVGEIKENDIELAYYIDKWCKYLNYYIGGEHNREMIFGDTEYTRLEAWLDGYNFAKKYDVDYEKSKITIRTKEYLIILAKPFEI